MGTRATPLGNGIGRDVGNQIRPLPPELVRQVLDAINGAVLTVSEEDRIALSNRGAARLFCTTTENLHGRPFRQLFMPEDRDVFVSKILEVTRRDGEFEGEVMLRQQEGRAFLGRVATSLGPWGGAETVVATFSDVSRLKRLERYVRRSERVTFLGRMLNDISHQIRNPVLSIGGFARRLARVDVPRAEYVQVILNEAAHLELLLETLTSFVRLPRACPKTYALAALFDELKGPLARIAEPMTLRWEVDIPVDTGREIVAADARLLAQALEAVLLNACEAYEGTDRDRVVRLQAGHRLREVWGCTLTITDWGGGIRPQIQPLIFDPFFTTKTGHLGMGLTFAKKILEEQGGEISVQSTLGEGTRVDLSLAGERRRPVRTRQIERPHGAPLGRIE